MTFRTLRRSLLALALVAPISAAHPTETPVIVTSGSAPDAFAGEFATFAQLPEAPGLSEGAVDVAAIEHTHGDASAETLGQSLGTGSASYYAAKFHGRRTASGERFDNAAMTAAHRTLPFGTKVRVTNPSTGKSVVVRINDRGPFTRGRMIDVTHAAAKQLGLIARGHGTVELALVE